MSKTSKTFIAEFVFRGGPDGAAGWHVVLGAPTVDPFGGASKPAYSRPMTPGQAEEAGFPLLTVLPQINDAILKRAEDALAAEAAAKAETARVREAAAAEIDQLNGKISLLEGSLKVWKDEAETLRRQLAQAGAASKRLQEDLLAANVALKLARQGD